MYTIRMGVPEMEALWNDLSQRAKAGKLKKDEKQFFKKWVKAMGYLRDNPRHPGLKRHEIEAISKRVDSRSGNPTWKSESRPRGGYNRVKLSDLPEEK